MVEIVAKGTDKYPERFGRLSDAPKQIFVKGALPAESMIALIGTRKCDGRMSLFTRRLASELVQCGFVVLSGGALGIDTAAHEGALEANGKTVAVIGSGFDHMYPAANRRLFEHIAENGALVSEFEPPVPPARWTFPRRNRLVAALASAVVVVQAPTKSGALITARLAGDMGVPVGAVPCEPGNTLGAGCNQLVKNGARMVENGEDVVKMAMADKYCHQLDLLVTRKQVIDTSDTAPPELSEQEREIWRHMCSQPMHIDAIIQRTSLTPGFVGATLMKLELSGLIYDVGGKRFVANS